MEGPDARKAIALCFIGLALLLAGKSARSLNRTPRTLPVPAAGGPAEKRAAVKVSLEDRDDLPLTAAVIRAWASASESGPRSRADLAAETEALSAQEEDEAPPARPFLRLKKWKKKRKASAAEIARKLQDPDAAADDGTGAGSREDSRAAAIGTQAQLRAAMAEEDRKSAQEDEPEDDPLWGRSSAGK